MSMHTGRTEFPLAFIAFAMFLVGIQAQAKIVGEEVSYEANGLPMKGFIAYDDSTDKKRPGVLVVHEWWGHNDYARKRAKMLAELGYTALAVDMYGNGKSVDHPKDAGELSGAVFKDFAGAQTRFDAAKTVLQNHPTTNSDKIAAIGYCFGGGIVLAMARRGVDLDAAVSFHGSLATQTPAAVGDIKAKVLVCNGDADPFVKPDQITAFKQEMKNAKVDLQFKSYAGAKHAFSNPDADAYGAKFNIPLQYNETADKQSWQDMQVFLTQAFK